MYRLAVRALVALSVLLAAAAPDLATAGQRDARLGVRVRVVERARIARPAMMLLSSPPASARLAGGGDGTGLPRGPELAIQGTRGLRHRLTEDWVRPRSAESIIILDGGGIVDVSTVDDESVLIITIDW